MENSVYLKLSLPLLGERLDEYVQGIGRALSDHKSGWRVAGSHLIAEIDAGGYAVDPLLQRAARSLRGHLPQAVLVEVGPDVMALRGIDALIGMPHGSLEALRDEYPESFPRPGFAGGDLWHLIHVLRWVRAVGAIHVDPGLVDIASACEQFNAVLCARRAWRSA